MTNPKCERCGDKPKCGDGTECLHNGDDSYCHHISCQPQQEKVYDLLNRHLEQTTKDYTEYYDKPQQAPMNQNQKMGWDVEGVVEQMVKDSCAEGIRRGSHDGAVGCVEAIYKVLTEQNNPDRTRALVDVRMAARKFIESLKPEEVKK